MAEREKDAWARQTPWPTRQSCGNYALMRLRSTYCMMPPFR